MTWLKNHLRDKFLAGALAAVPVVVVVWGALLVEQYTRPLAQQVGLDFSGLGVLLAVVGSTCSAWRCSASSAGSRCGWPIGCCRRCGA